MSTTDRALELIELAVAWIAFYFAWQYVVGEAVSLNDWSIMVTLFLLTNIIYRMFFKKGIK